MKIHKINQVGFTFAEMIICVSILAIIGISSANLAIPLLSLNVNNLSSHRINNSLTIGLIRIANDLQEAQSLGATTPTSIGFLDANNISHTFMYNPKSKMVTLDKIEFIDNIDNFQLTYLNAKQLPPIAKNDIAFVHVNVTSSTEGASVQRQKIISIRNTIP